MKTSIQDKIISRINAFDNGEVFAISDFEDVANAKTVSKILERIAGSMNLSKIARGIFWKPCGDSPEPEKVAKAIARSNSWTIAPCGETAKHCFGLASEPREWTFVTSGTYRDYKFDNYKISFHHTTEKMLAKMSEKTALLVQVLKAYGEEHIPENIREKVALYSHTEKDRIISETRCVTEWISGAIRKMLSK